MLSVIAALVVLTIFGFASHGLGGLYQDLAEPHLAKEITSTLIGAGILSTFFLMYLLREFFTR